jgi:predicted dehydrogenase
MNRRDFLKAGGAAAMAAVASRPLYAAGAGARPLRVVQIGTEHSHGRGKWATITKFPGLFTPVGVWEPFAAVKAQSVKFPEYAGVRWLEEKEVWAEKPDAILVETDLPDLLEYGRRVLEHGCHLHLDKPPGADLEKFVGLQSIARRRRLVFQTGYMFRYQPAFRFAFDAARNGMLGRVFAVHGDIGSDMTMGRRSELAQRYGGSMLLLGSHLVDLAVAVMGVPAKVSVTRHQSYPEHDNYYDNEVAVLDYPTGSAVIRCLNSEVNGGQRRQFLVFGQNGTVEILPLEPAQVRLSLKEARGGFKTGTQQVDLPAITGRYDEMMQDFARLIRGEPSIVPQFDAAHELASHRTVLDIARRG